jgi:hypothetical protein
MSKPKNRVICPDCGRPKMLFETEKKAQLFIKFNGDSITDDVSKLRTYYCPACCGYHITSKPVNPKGYHNTERMIKNYHKDVERGTKVDILSAYKPEIIEKCRPYVDKVYKEYYDNGNHMIYSLQQYLKFYYSDKLGGLERECLLHMVKGKRDKNGS